MATIPNAKASARNLKKKIKEEEDARKREILKETKSFPVNKLLEECAASIKDAVGDRKSSTTLFFDACWKKMGWSGSADTIKDVTSNSTTQALLQVCEKQIVPTLKKKGYEVSCKIDIEKEEDAAYGQVTDHVFTAGVRIKISW